MRPRIYVIGYPRSGTTWLCRLIADAWNCPIGSIHSQDIFHGHPAEGKDRDGPFVVLHGHKPAHKLEPDVDDYVIFIYRDPRDVIVSISHYFKRPLDECINDAINGRPGVKGPLKFPIEEYVGSWTSSPIVDYVTKYEYLHTDAALILYDIYELLQEWPINNIAEVVKRQTFDVRRESTETLNFDKDYHLRHMRKGIVGDWENHFTPEQLQKVKDGMRGLGYW